VAIDYTDPVSGVRRSGYFESRFDPAALRSLAEAGGGVYIPAVSMSAFVEVMDRINSEEMSVGRMGTRSRTESFAEPILAAALILLLLAWFLQHAIMGAYL
jgi:hypothetical protein